MQHEGNAFIYLAAQRQCHAEATSLGYSLFDLDIFPEQKPDFLKCCTGFEDISLEGETTRKLPVHGETVIVLLPLIGGIELVSPSGQREFLSPGEWILFGAGENNIYTLLNPFEATVNYLLLTFHPQTGLSRNEKREKGSFDLEKRDRLHPFALPEEIPVRISIGKYGGREEEKLHLAGSGLLAYVIEGAFEVHHRLLQPRDGLTVWNTPSVEFEALSNDAILLVLESI